MLARASPRRRRGLPGPAATLPEARSGPVLPSDSWRSPAGIRFATCWPSNSRWSACPRPRSRAGCRPPTCVKPPTPTSSRPSSRRGPAQIRVDIHDGHLTLHGRRDARVACEQYHQVERGHGEFSRTFRLPTTWPPTAYRPSSRTACSPIVVPKLAGARAPPRRRRMSAVRRIAIAAAAPARPASRPAWSCRGACAPPTTPSPNRPPRRPPRGRPAPRPRRSPPGPRLHARRRADHRRGHQHRVAAGGAPLGLAVRQRSVLPVLLRRRRRDVRQPQPLRVEPGLGRGHLGRRLRAHQQSCRRRRRSGGHGRPRPTSASCAPRSLAWTPRPTWRCSRSTPRGLPDDSLGRLVQAEGRRVGDGHRQPVPAQLRPSRSAS